MKFATVALALAIGTSPFVAHAQDSVKTDEQIIVKQVQSDRRAVLAQSLGLTESESRVFWPIYDQYEAAMKKVTDRRLAMLDKYASKYDTLTDEDADELIKARMQIDKDALALRQKYGKQIQKALPSKKALRYMQVQDRIDNMLAAQAYSIIPLAR